MHLIIGASGQVGGALLGALNESGLDCLGTYHKNNPLSFDGEDAGSEAVLGEFGGPGSTRSAAAAFVRLDLGDGDAIKELLQQIRPSHIYLPASYTNVDGCEADPGLSSLINVEAVKRVIACAGDADLIYFSSDYVFDGEAGPYGEDEPTAPISVYGRHKVEAEALLASSGLNSLIVRTTVVFGPERQGKNFVLRLIKTLAGGDEIAVPDDQVGTPTYNRALAHTVLELVKRNESGIFHVAGEESCSRYELALAVADAFDLDQNLIVPVSTDMLDQKAARPLRAGLKVDKVRHLLGKKAQLTGFREALAELRLIAEAD
ncbi:MAG: SDR family oxidoreductase [Cyanobacteria bacterium REEB67]|nr:SDR family oxidoreductase [Cyanobacteria bacterium REEB67]